MTDIKGFSKINTVLSRFDKQKDKYISKEFQMYAYDLAEALGDMAHKSLYMKLAKETPRAILEKAKNFVKDAYNVDNKGRLFMWKLSQIKKELKDKK